ncbi:MAG: cation acetate symporter [Microscillaceae bacterium]|nr:cation acetate symporter [Microscillaceae bacterium]
MSILVWTYIIVGISFALYIGIAMWARAASTKEFYVAGGGVSPTVNGMATAADWMSAASFLSMAGIIAFSGYDGSVYLMGWTGGYVLLALLLAPYLRKFGKFTVPDFVGERYYSQTARTVAVICALFVSFTYVAGQMRGVGIVFARFLEVSIDLGVIIGMAIVFFYAVLGGMKGITYTQVAQYCVLIFAYLVPAIFISFQLTGNPIPQLGMGGTVEGGGYLMDKLDGLSTELGLGNYTDPKKPMLDTFFIAFALMVGTAGLPHVIVRFFTVAKVKDARSSAGLALVFIAILYTTAPAIAVFSKYNLINAVGGKEGIAYKDAPQWVKNWENAKLIGWVDKNGDGKIQYSKGTAVQGKLEFDGIKRGANGERVVKSKLDDKNTNELIVDNDIMVLAMPEVAKLPNWVIGLVAAGGLAAALSTAAGLLLVISSAVSHDLLKQNLMPNISEKTELFYARIAAAAAVVLAGYFGINPPGFVASVVAFAFGLAAASFFPIIIMGIFSKRMNMQGAISGMIVGLLFTISYIIYYKFIDPTATLWFGISPEGVGTLGMILNFVVATIVSSLTPPPPQHVQDMVESIRYPRGAKEAVGVH